MVTRSKAKAKTKRGAPALAPAPQFWVDARPRPGITYAMWPRTRGGYTWCGLYREGEGWTLGNGDPMTADECENAESTWTAITRRKKQPIMEYRRRAVRQSKV